jgi:hypothetical protein
VRRLELARSSSLELASEMFDSAMDLHFVAGNGDVLGARRLVAAGADVNKQHGEDGPTPLHLAAYMGHVEMLKVLVELGADVDAQAANGETALQFSVRSGKHQVVQVLRELERAARTQKAAATSARTRQLSRQDTPETREAAERMGAQLIEEEERDVEAAAQAKVRVAPPSPHIGLHSVQLGGERCGVSVARVSAFPLTA